MAQANSEIGGASRRIFEIDLLRGTAIMMMILYNWLFALNYLGVYHTAIMSGFWPCFARITASIFIILAGASLTISASKHQNDAHPYIHHIKRGLRYYLLLSVGITIVTWLFLKNAYVRFGILHLIGSSIILAYPLLNLRYWNIFLGAVFIAAGIHLQSITAATSWLLWLGFVPNNFYTVDYFPILPWFGVFLVGVFLGNALYENGARKYKIRESSGIWITDALAFLGRNSLFIYITHQPILIVMLYLLGFDVVF